MRTSFSLLLSAVLSRYKAHLNDLIMYKIAVSAFGRKDPVPVVGYKVS